MYTSAGQKLALFAVLMLASCTPPPRMCSAEGDCGSQAACVAGRCLARGATPAIDTARRMLFPPADVAYLRRDANTHGVATVTLGCAHEPVDVVLLRFSARLPPEVHVLEAYVLLERANELFVSPAPIALQAARIVDAWDSQSVSWARQPRLDEAGAPITRVWPSAGRLVRLDVRALVQRWRRMSGEDFGIAVRAQEVSATGMAFALEPAVAKPDDAMLARAAPPSTQGGSPLEPHPPPPASIAEPRAEFAGPTLEVYVK
jgi:hypothetical protein